ncbi:hypothetical protein BDZ89DRAFT_1150571 [Hymenopellis radicata]|nr:hypothetical protein BDZ89DRAFT_1150571 [Hymenopellis radicata]
MSMPTTTTEAVTPILGVTASVQSSVDAAMDPHVAANLDDFELVPSPPAVQNHGDQAGVASTAMPSVDADLQAHLPLVGDPALNVHARSASVNGIVGVVYDTVPLSMAYNAEVVADRYYVVSKGRRSLFAALLRQPLITGIPGGSNKHYETQQKAVDVFNGLLAIPGVLYKYDIFVLAPHLTLSSPLMAASAFEQELEQEFNRYDKFLSELDPVALDAALDGHITPENDLDLVDALEGLSLYATPPQTPPRTPTRLSPPLTQYRLLSPTRKAGIPETTEHWEDVAVQIAGVPSVTQGYASKTAAEEAFAHARACGWLPHDKHLPAAAALLDIPFLTAAEASFANPLNRGITNKRWYCVYQGRRPGIYRSNLECQLNVHEVSKASYESWGTLSLAREKYLNAQREGTVRSLTLHTPPQGTEVFKVVRCLVKNIPDNIEDLSKTVNHVDGLRMVTASAASNAASKIDIAMGPPKKPVQSFELSSYNLEGPLDLGLLGRGGPGEVQVTIKTRKSNMTHVVSPRPKLVPSPAALTSSFSAYALLTLLEDFPAVPTG